MLTHTQGPDGKRRLEEGPNLQSYRGIRIIHTHQFPMQVRSPLQLSHSAYYFNAIRHS